MNNTEADSYQIKYPRLTTYTKSRVFTPSGEAFQKNSPYLILTRLVTDLVCLNYLYHHVPMSTHRAFSSHA